MVERFVSDNLIAAKYKLYRQFDVLSCASAALRIAYGAYGIKVSEQRIYKDLNIQPDRGIFWDEMMRHVSLQGLYPYFFYNYPYEVLMGMYYDNKYAIIVGWMACRDETLMHHCCPVSFILPNKIGLVDSSTKSILPLSRERFEKKWMDSANTKAPFLVISQTHEKF